MKVTYKLVLAACCMFAMATTTYAIPGLQLYVEGAEYNADTESWHLVGPTGSSAGAPFRVWVIGNVDGPGGHGESEDGGHGESEDGGHGESEDGGHGESEDGGHGEIEDVRISFSYESGVGTPTFSLTGSTTGDYGGFTDPSVATAATYVQTVSDGSSPTFGNGRSVPRHGIFGAGTEWQEFAIGEFEEEDSPIADFIDTFPSAPADPSGQINVYEVSVLNGSGLTFHIDAYGYDVFAPFSHDVSIIPAPGAALLACLGLGMIGRIKRRAD